MGNYLIEFKGRNKSGRENQNFLWKEQNVYIMDNHRAALWCWIQHYDKNKKCSLFHIDQHYDTGPSIIQKSKNNMPDLFAMTIEDYLNLEYEAEENKGFFFKTFRYDNYLTIFLENFSPNIKEVEFVTQKEGTLIKYEVCEKEIYHLIGNLDYWLSYDDNWIFNLDLDIVFNFIEDERVTQLLSDELVIELGKIIRKNLDEGRIKVLTVALSPEFCGGWSESERVLKLLTDNLNIDFNLPKVV